MSVNSTLGVRRRTQGNRDNTHYDTLKLFIIAFDADWGEKLKEKEHMAPQEAQVQC